MIWGVYSREVAISFFPAKKRVRGNKTGPMDYIEHSVPLAGGDLGVIKLNRNKTMRHGQNNASKLLKTVVF